MKNFNANELTALIEEGLTKIINDGKFLEYLQFYSRFRKYSYTNTLLIFCACPHATYVAGYKQWQEMGRYVAEGQKGIMIFAPIFRNHKEEYVNEQGEVQERVVKHIRGFRSVYVFDVSQTGGKDMPEEYEQCKNFGNDTELLGRFIGIFGDKYKVTQIPLKEGLSGYIKADNSIVLNSDMSEEQRLQTLIHEVAHGELGHFTDKTKKKDTQELEAEITGYIVARHFGIDSSENSFDYLISWSRGDISKVREALQSAYEMADAIIEQIEAAEKTQQMAS